MLISHLCKFIYLKTRKTAGTSVEMYFEPYCVDPKRYSGDRHDREPEVSEWGIVGSRGVANDGLANDAVANNSWYNHMSAERIRELIGAEIWDSYYKFCVIRNPFDKVVSYFWFDVCAAIREALQHADFSLVRKSFAEWTELWRFPADGWIYTIGSAPAVDDFVRYERLHADLERVCRRLNVPWQPERLGRYKSGYRKRAEHFLEYYTPETAHRVREAFAWEFGYFNYPGAPAELPKPLAP
jgi:hypothetical protein